MVLGGAGTTDRVEVVAVASRDRTRAEEYARAHGIERAHGSYDDLLADVEVDAVYVSLPNSLHVDWAVRALEAGKHVLCEKPLARDPAQVERAFDAAERAGRVLMEAFMYRHNPQTTRLVELVREGAIGTLRTVRSVFDFTLEDPGNIRLSAKLAGGSLMDVGCYCVSAARLLAGEPERVYAEQQLGGDGVDVAFYGTIRFPGDVVAQFDSSFLVPVRQELEAVGEEGALRVGAPFRTDLGPTVIELRRGDGLERIAVEERDSYGLELENLADAVEGRAEPLLGRAESVGQARAIDGLYRSAESGLPVDL